MGRCEYFRQSVGFIQDPSLGESEAEEARNPGIGPHTWCNHPRLPKWLSSPAGALLCDGDATRCPIPANLR
ncbi:MAG: hypothetical protein HY900_26565 [Deltaproteobacteria bacterium]|nr:hypothetical protein [Deltaproteobacteria bacterium]